jgi:Holliday junction DNA helicase RuvA
VGYRLLVAPKTAASLQVGQEGFFAVHTHVRESAITLYGFASPEERTAFELLLGAHGVGPGLALAILSIHEPVELARVIASGDVEALKLVPGVGQKTAARLLLELQARFDYLGTDGVPRNGGGRGAFPARLRARGGAQRHAGPARRGDRRRAAPSGTSQPGATTVIGQ